MTLFEHALVGVNGALAGNLHRHHGWPIVAMAALAAMLPDWDGLTILLGVNCYATAHRVWGHNLLVGGLLALVISGLAWRLDALVRIRRWLARRWPALDGDQGAACRGGWALWMAVGLLASYSHLLADVFYSAGRGLPVWGVPLFWPFSSASYAYPLVPWGDIGTTGILVVGMFALLRWKMNSRLIAITTLAVLIAYMAARGCL